MCVCVCAHVRDVDVFWCVCVCMFSHVQPFATPWTVARQAPLSKEFSRQEYWSKLPIFWRVGRQNYSASLMIHKMYSVVQAYTNSGETA